MALDPLPPSEDLLVLADKLDHLKACCICASTHEDPAQEMITAIKAIKTLWRIFALRHGMIKKYNLSTLKPDKVESYTTKNRLRYKAYYRRHRNRLLEKQRATIRAKKQALLTQTLTQKQKGNENV
jgi:thymidine kinase